jgi:hypothetical protein
MNIVDEIMTNPDSYVNFLSETSDKVAIQHDIETYKNNKMAYTNSKAFISGFDALPSLFWVESYKFTKISSNILHKDAINLFYSEKGYVQLYKKFMKNSTDINICGAKQDIDHIAKFFDSINIKYTIRKLTEVDSITNLKESSKKKNKSINIKITNCDGNNINISNNMGYFHDTNVYVNVVFTGDDTHKVEKYKLYARFLKDTMKNHYGKEVRLCCLSKQNYKSVMNECGNVCLTLDKFIEDVKSIITEDMTEYKIDDDFLTSIGVPVSELSLFRSTINKFKDLTNKSVAAKTDILQKVLIQNDFTPYANLLYGSKKISDLTLSKKQLQDIKKFFEALQDSLIQTLLFSETSYKIDNSKNILNNHIVSLINQKMR